MGYAIAIDGPAGAGKSTIAKNIAKELGFIYVDTGAMYRAMAVFVNDCGIDPANEAAVVAQVHRADISIDYIDGVQQVILNGENVTDRLRLEQTGKAASLVSKYLPVRQKLVELQRKLAAQANVVMDGRDIATAVLPDADVKVYLTASADTRAKRRLDELAAKGEPADFEQIKADIEARDYQDMHREHSPLVQAASAVLVDSSDMTIEEVTKTIIDLTTVKGKGRICR